MQKRDSVITLSRVLGTVFIVLCHIIQYYTFIPGSATIGKFLSCGVELFIFISGYLYGKKNYSSNFRFRQWYFKRVITISLPAILVSIIVIGVLFTIQKAVDFNTVIIYLIDAEGIMFLNWRLANRLFTEILSLGPLWFTTIIMLCYLLVPLLSRINIKNIRLFSFVKNVHLLFVGLLFVAFLISTILYDYIVIHYFLFFIIGFYFGKFDFLNRIKNKWMLSHSILFIIALLGRFVFHKYIPNSVFYPSYVLFAHFVFGTWFVVFFAYLRNIIPNLIDKLASNKMVKQLDNYSFYIFLVHAVFCSGEFNLYNKMGIILSTIFFILCVSISSFLLKILCDAVKKIIFNKLEKCNNIRCKD